MKRLLIGMLILLPLIFGCSPEPIENNIEPPEPTFVIVDAKFQEDPNNTCFGIATVTCYGPGDECIEEGTKSGYVYNDLDPNCNSSKNPLSKKSEGAKAIEKYINANKFKDFFNDKNWKSILPSLKRNRRVVQMVKDRDLCARLIGENNLLIYMTSEPPKDFLDKSKILMFVPINNFSNN